MQTWKERLDAQRAEQDRIRAEREAEQAQLAQQNRETRFFPMPDRIKKILRHMPPDIQQRGISLATLRMNLAGKFRGQAAPREVAAGLRELGWIRRRDWTKDGPFVALWYPPEKADNSPIQPVSKRGNTRQSPKSRKAQRAA